MPTTLELKRKKIQQILYMVHNKFSEIVSVPVWGGAVKCHILSMMCVPLY